MIPLVIAIIGSAILSALRLSGDKTQFFQAIAHIFVAWIFCHAYYRKSSGLFWVGVALSLVEVFAFLKSRGLV